MIKNKYFDPELQRLFNENPNNPGNYERLIFALKYGYLPEENSFLQEILVQILENESKEYREKILNLLINEAILDTSLLYTLISMEKEISLPILEYALTLNSELLIKLIKEIKDKEKLSFIAKRSNLNNAVIKELMKKEIFEVELQLLLNATVTEQYKDIILNSSSNNRRLIENILSGDKTDYNVTCLLSHLPKKLKSFAEKNDVHNKINAVYKYRENYANQCHNILAMQNEIDCLFTENKLFAILLFKLLCKGDILSFIYGLSKLTDTPYAHLKDILYDNYDSESLEQIYDRAHLPKHSRSAIITIYQVIISSISCGNLNHQNFQKVVVEQLAQVNLSNKIAELDYYLNVIRANN